MSSQPQTKTITITVKVQTDLSGSFRIPFTGTPMFNFEKGKSLPMKDTPLVSVSPDGKQTIAGHLKVENVPGFGTVTYSGNFELDNQGDKGIVKWDSPAQEEDDWNSRVTTPIPEKEGKSYG